MKKSTDLRKEYTLCPQTVDMVAVEVERLCETYGYDRKDIQRLRLSVEESLLVWLRELGEGAAVCFEAGTRLRKPYFRLSVQGKNCNPYNIPSEDFGSSQSLLVRIGMLPTYSYSRESNILVFNLKRKKLNQLIVLVLVILAALLVGIGGVVLLPESLIAFLNNDIIGPIEDTMFRILSCIAGPMIFLSVAWGIYGIGDVYTLGRIGKRLMFNYLKIVFVFTAAGAFLYPLLGPALTAISSQNSQFGAFFEMILDIFPADVFSPFVNGNTLQIIFLAVVVGVSLIFLGQRTASVARAVEQINNIINFLMDFISQLVPYFVFIVLVEIIWSGNLSVFTSVWRFALVFLSAELVFVLLLFVFVSRRNHVPVLYSLRACLPSFLIAVTTASSAASFDSNMAVCRKKFGVSDSLASFSIPFGMVMFKPNTALYYLLFCFYFATVYGVSVSFSWIVIAVVICAISAVATPPIPGGAAATYTAMLLQLGIPSEALAVALAVDMLFDFVLTSGDMVSLILETFHVSVKTGMQDEKPYIANEKGNVL